MQFQSRAALGSLSPPLQASPFDMARILHNITMSTKPVAAASSSPLIGVVSNMLVVESNPFPGLERSYVNHDYISAVEAAGAVPVMLPIVTAKETIRRQIQAVDAILLTGGYDPNPLLYGENPNRRIEFIFPEVDEYQLQTIRLADELGKPMLGICRGIQILNIAFGGTLYQDLSLIPNSYIQHFQKSRRDTQGHQVHPVKETLLAQIFPESVILTNSFHHLALRDVAPGFVVNAYAPDGVIEGFERQEGTPVLAVQWHPEMMYRKHPEMLRIFTRFRELVQEQSGA